MTKKKVHSCLLRKYGVKVEFWVIITYYTYLSILNIL